MKTTTDLPHRILPSLILGGVLLSVYLGTLAPGLTWANDGADGGDLIAAAATGGVAHPSGYPLYLLIASLFQHLPLGTLAFRTNLLSALAAVGAALLVHALVTALPDSPARGNRPAGLLAGFLFGLAPLVWSQAVITEVYALQAALTALVLVVCLWRPRRISAGWMDGLRGLALGLALGNHLTAALMLPAVLAFALWQPGWKPRWAAGLRFLAGLGGGLLVYLALPLRALSGAPVNWGNPVSWNNFTWLVSGELYQRRLLAIPLDGILQRLQSLAELLVRQFELPSLLLALIGLIYFFKPGKLVFLTLWNALAYSTFAVLYASFDSYLYLIPVILSGAVWAGLGLGGLLNDRQKFFPGLRPLVYGLLALLLAGLVLFRWPQVDASRDGRAEQFGAQVMCAAPRGALIFAQGDQAVFTLWYFHYALGQRPDLVVMASDLLHFNWYDQTLRRTYPGLTWPEDLFWEQTVTAANPQRPVCQANAAAQSPLACSVEP